MVTRWGMSDRVGLVQLAPRANPYLGGVASFGADRPFSETTACLIDEEVQRILGESHAEACRLLRVHRRPLDALVGALLERETLDEREVLEVTGLPPAAELPGRPDPGPSTHDAPVDRREAGIAAARARR
jgi:cell division protease FtsH